MLVTESEKYMLLFQDDGNLVLYINYYDEGRKALWSSGTADKGAELVCMQSDGNLVVSSSNNSALFSTGSSNNKDAYLCLQEDGNLVIYQRFSRWNRPNF